MSPLFTTPKLRRTLSVVYRFYDAFFFPVDDDTLPIQLSLDVSIPRFRWNAFRAENDFTYRFSSLTIAETAPAGTNLPVQVIDPSGLYVNFEDIAVTLPLPLVGPPTRAHFLRPTPLWPTVGLRPPDRETVVRGQIRSPTAQPIEGLKVEMWQGGAALPPPSTPFTRSNANGDFLYRFPLVKGSTGSLLPLNIQLEGGSVAITPASLSIALGGTQFIQFNRT